MKSTLKSQLEQAAQREKHWGELTSDEKIERMRLIVKQINRDICGLEEKIRKLIEHQHNDKGELIIVRKMSYYGEPEREGRRKEDSDIDVYF